jgi:hypothetical protein
MKTMIPGVYRFSKLKWLEDSLKNGAFRLSPASSFKQIENDTARLDDECLKKHISPKSTSRVYNVTKGQNIPLLSDITFESELLTDYYILSFSTQYHNYFYDDFSGSEVCLVINDVEKFSQVFYEYADAHFPNWLVRVGSVTYGGPSHYGVPFEKTHHYIFQHEWRCVLVPKEPVSKLEHTHITLGSLEAIAEIKPSGRSIYREAKGINNK